MIIKVVITIYILIISSALSDIKLDNINLSSLEYKNSRLNMKFLISKSFAIIISKHGLNLHITNSIFRLVSNCFLTGFIQDDEKLIKLSLNNEFESNDFKILPKFSNDNLVLSIFISNVKFNQFLSNFKLYIVDDIGKINTIIINYDILNIYDDTIQKLNINSEIYKYNKILLASKVNVSYFSISHYLDNNRFEKEFWPFYFSFMINSEINYDSFILIKLYNLNKRDIVKYLTTNQNL